MHSSHVLDEEVFAVEIVVGDDVFECFSTVAAALVAVESLGFWWAQITPPESQAEMLGCCVSFPFVLCAEGCGAAVWR